MPILDYQSLMLPVLSAALDGEIRIGDFVEKLAKKLGLTLEERAERCHPVSKQSLAIEGDVPLDVEKRKKALPA